MPKPKDKHDEQHLKNVQLYLKRIQELYKLASDEASKIGCSINGVDSSKPFSFDDYPQTQKKMNALLSKFKKSLEVSIVNGIDAEWALSNSKNDEIVNKAFGSKKDKLTDEQKKRYFNNNEDAKDAFIERKRNDLSLSDSVWDFTKRFKSEIEMGLDLGIRSGKSADQMSRSLRDYLQNTNKLFRRYKDEHGILQLSKAAKAFHPGQGVYRSSYMNARRLAATETNIAYRTADHLRWKEMDFVVGIEIHLSNNHTCKGRDGKPHDFHDICDELQGKYPKDFKFTGWHPHCRCFATTILKTPDELKSGKASKNEVKELPSKFKEWYENNKERIDKAKSLPYFIKDNFKDGEFIGQKTTKNSPIENNPIENKPKRNKPLTTLEKAKIRQDERTKKQIADIQKRWDERKKSQSIILKTEYKTLQDVDETFKEINSKLTEKWFANGDLKLSDTSKNVNGFTYNDGRISLTKERNVLVRSALGKIGQSKEEDITFEEADAMATFWHEITHNRNVYELIALNTKQRAVMELMNEFVARKTLPEFYKVLGCKNTPHEIFMDDRKSTGYNSRVLAYDYIIKTLQLDAEKVLESAKNNLFNLKYTEQDTTAKQALLDGGLNKLKRTDNKLISKTQITKLVNLCRLGVSTGTIRNYLKSEGIISD